MAPPPLSWLFRLAALCHLTMLLTGQHHGVNRCNITCNEFSKKKIPMRLLSNYRRNQASCGKPAIILETVKNKLICADPREKWVQDAMAHLDHKATAPAQNGSKFEPQVGAPRTAPAATGVDRPAVSEPTPTGDSSSQEAQRALGTSPELPTRVAGSWTPGPRTTSKALAGPERTQLHHPAAVTTTTSWQNSAVYQPRSVFRAAEKHSEVASTETPSTPALPTQAPSSPAPSTPTPSTPAPSTQAPSTQAPSTQAPTISHAVTKDHSGSEGQTVWITTQTPMPETSLGSNETDLISAHTDAFMGPSGMPHVSMAPVSSEGAPSGEPVTSGSWVPKITKSTHSPENSQTQKFSGPYPTTQRQAIGLFAFLGLLFCLGVAMFAYQSLQACHVTGDMVEGLRYVPRSCGSNSYVLVPV